MKKLNSWFEIDEKEYLMYILQGYKINVYTHYVFHKLDGKLHRENGPAYIGENGTKQWWINGQRHRADGPAVIETSGTKEWWLNGRKYTEEKFNKEVIINHASNEVERKRS